MKKIALGETLPVQITKVEKLDGREKFKVLFQDDEGDEGLIILDVEMPLGRAEIRVIHQGD